MKPIETPTNNYTIDQTTMNTREKTEVGSRKSEDANWAKLRTPVFGLLTLLTLFSCETTINPELDTPKEIIVVDAWVNQKMERQIIRVTRSQPYFDNAFPSKIPNLEVTVEDMDNGVTYSFLESQDYYYWDPVDEPFGEVGHTYRLSVTVNGETFEAFSKLGRVPPVDSVTFTYNEKDLIIKEEYYTAEFMASDPVGIGDAYWIKAWKNNTLLNKPSELNMAFDAGFSAGQAVDGQVFLIPIRKDFLNPLDKIPDGNNEFYPPYLVGDSVHVEIHSLDPQAFDFLYAIYLNVNRPGGFAELFSMPLVNSPTNFQSTIENSPTNIAGFFNVSAVSSGGRKLTQKLADWAKQNKN